MEKFFHAAAFFVIREWGFVGISVPFSFRHPHHAGVSAAGDAVFEDRIHVVLHQAFRIIFFLDLFQRFLAGRFHVAALRVFEFNDNAGVFVRNFDQDVAVAGDRKSVV